MRLVKLSLCFGWAVIGSGVMAVPTIFEQMNNSSALYGGFTPLDQTVKLTYSSSSNNLAPEVKFSNLQYTLGGSFRTEMNRWQIDADLSLTLGKSKTKDSSPKQIVGFVAACNAKNQAHYTAAVDLLLGYAAITNDTYQLVPYIKGGFHTEHTAGIKQQYALMLAGLKSNFALKQNIALSPYCEVGGTFPFSLALTPPHWFDKVNAQGGIAYGTGLEISYRFNPEFLFTTKIYFSHVTCTTKETKIQNAVLKLKSKSNYYGINFGIRWHI